MAASGYTPIQLYHSTTPSAEPDAGDLVAGELALNVADGYLFFKNVSGIVENIAGLSGYSGISGYSGFSGFSGRSGFSGFSGISGFSGRSGFSGYSGASGYIGVDGASGYSGYSGFSGAVGPGASLSSDTTTASFLYPMFAAVTTGLPGTVYTSSPKYLYKPSTGELQAEAVISENGLTLNKDTVSTNYTVGSGYNAMSVSPISIGSGITVTVLPGQRWVVL